MKSGDKVRSRDNHFKRGRLVGLQGSSFVFVQWEGSNKPVVWARSKLELATPPNPEQTQRKSPEWARTTEPEKRKID